MLQRISTGRKENRKCTRQSIGSQPTARTYPQAQCLPLWSASHSAPYPCASPADRAQPVPRYCAHTRSTQNSQIEDRVQELHREHGHTDKLDVPRCGVLHGLDHSPVPHLRVVQGLPHAVNGRARHNLVQLLQPVLGWLLSEALGEYLCKCGERGAKKGSGRIRGGGGWVGSWGWG